MINQLGYIGIGVKDTAAWEEFATNILGMELSEKLDDGTLYLRMDEYHHRIIIEPTGNDDLNYAGWGVATHDDLNEAQARLQAAGVTVEEGSPEECTYRQVVRFITFKDPDDLRVEIFLGLHVNADTPFNSPRGVTGFKTTASNGRPMGLGHILPGVKDVDVTERFYRDVLGFKNSDYIMMTRPDGQKSKLAFFHVNPRHHSYAIGAMPGMKRRLTHFMIEAKSLDDVGFAYDRCKENGVNIQQELGRHSNDLMFSFYMTNPSGFGVEFGFDGREVNDDNWVIQNHHTARVWGGNRFRQPQTAGTAPR
jgi:2,3-dihydroxybiphenyl 1,2-dioxygenase